MILKVVMAASVWAGIGFSCSGGWVAPVRETPKKGNVDGKASMVKPYLALFTFQSSSLDELTDEQLRLLEESPYDGMAFWLVKENSLDPPPEVAKVAPRLRKIRQVTRKDLWPFVFLNRILQQDEKGHRHGEIGANEGFRSIRGMDLDNETGALGAFLLVWRRSLRIARRLGSPGVGLDPEFYNNYDLESLALLAKRRGESEDETLRKLHTLGARMADIVEEELPGAAIWCTFTRLRGRRESIQGVPGHILQGLLDRASDARIRLRLIEGGEDTIGYVPRSLDDLMQKIAKQEKEYAPRKAQYPQLALGGTMAPWLDREHRAYWMKDEPCADTVEDLEPFFRLLLERVEFVWIYGAGNAYNVWEKAYAERFHRVLKTAKLRARRRTGKGK